MASTVKLSNAPSPKNDAQTGGKSRQPRTRALLIASISSLDNSLSTPCLVNNISASGARMTLSASIPLSGEFKVFIPQRNLARHARLIWRKGDQLGIKFQQEADPTAPPDEDDKDGRIQALEAENAALRAEIGVLKNTLYRNEDF
jgi:hypothetical protein